MNNIHALLLKSEIRRGKWALIRRVLFLVPVLSIITLFAFAYIIPNINQIFFMNNANYQSIAYSLDYNARPNSFGLYSSEFGHAKVNGKTQFVLVENSISSEIYNILDCDYIFENTYFSHANLPQGFDPAALHDDEILLSYNLAKYLNVNVGEIVDIINPYEESSYKDVIAKSFTVAGIMKTKYSDSSFFGADKGIALIKVDSLKSNFVSYVQFVEEGGSYNQDASIVQKSSELQIPINNIFNGPTMALTGLLMPIMAALLVYLIVFREMKFVLQRHAKKSEILYVLGIDNKIIISYLWLQQVIILIISVLISAVLMKYILFEMYIGIFVEPLVLALIMVFQFLIGLLVSYLCFGRIKSLASSQTISSRFIKESSNG